MTLSRRPPWAALLTPLVALAPAAAAAEIPPICADRPGKATPACTVAVGHFQVETALAGWTLAKQSGDRATSLTIAATTVKYGLTDRSNLEVDFTPWQRIKSRVAGDHEADSGFGDVVLLYKHRVTAGDAVLQFAVIPNVKIPMAKHSLGNGKVEAGLIVPIQYAIPNSPFGLTLAPELDWLADADGSGRHASMTQVASLGWQVAPKVSVSGEVWTQWDWDPDGTTHQTSLDGAIAYAVNNDLQLDAGANFGLNRDTADIEIYTGISRRF